MQPMLMTPPLKKTMNEFWEWRYLRANDTYNAVVLAADGARTARVPATNTDDIDGGAIQPNRNIEVGKNDAQ